MKSENRDGEDEKGVDIAWWSILLGYLEEAGCSRKVASWRRVGGAIRYPVNARSFHVECARVLHESLLVLVLT